MEYKSELYETGNPFHIEKGEVAEERLMNVGLVLALSAIAISVAIIIAQNFTGAPLAQTERSLGKYAPVGDVAVLPNSASTGEIQK